MNRYRPEERLGRGSAMDNRTMIDIQGGSKSCTLWWDFVAGAFQSCSIFAPAPAKNGLQGMRKTRCLFQKATDRMILMLPCNSWTALTNTNTKTFYSDPIEQIIITSSRLDRR